MREKNTTLETNLIRIDVEDIERDVQKYLKCDAIPCKTIGQELLFEYNLDKIPDERDIRDLILYVIKDLDGAITFEMSHLVRLSFSVRTE